MAGIGNKKIYKIKSEKDITVSTRSAIFSTDMISLTQGVDIIDDKKVEITRVETICKDKDVTEVELEGTPVGEVLITDSKGVEHKLTASAKKLTFAPLTEQQLIDDEEVTVIYKEEVTGESIEFDAEKFSKNVRLELSTIAYDLNTNEVDSDLYFIFPRASVSDEFSLSFEAGSVITPELTFDILQPRCGSAMGEMIRVPRVTTP